MYTFMCHLCLCIGPIHACVYVYHVYMCVYVYVCVLERSYHRSGISSQIFQMTVSITTSLIESTVTHSYNDNIVVVSQMN